MADAKPLKLVDQGGGAGRLAEFEAGDTLPKAALPALSAADVGAVAADDPRLSDAREWTAATVGQAEAEAGTATTRRAWTAQRVAQAVRGAVLTGLSTASAAAVTATDSVLSALGKLQAQITGLSTSKLDANANAVSASKLQTARTINGVAFDGTANITVADATKEPSISAGTAQQFWRGDKTWGTIAASDVPSLDTSKLTTGVIADALLPDRLRGFCKYVADWNDANQNGWYMASPGAANAPDGRWYKGSVEVHNALWITQTVCTFTEDGAADTQTWRRDCNNGWWGAWYRLRLSEAEQSALYLNASNLNTGTLAEARLPDSGVLYPSLVNSFSVSGFTAGERIQYRKVAGIVTIIGMVKRSSRPNALLMFTLPVGYRPAAPLQFSQMWIRDGGLEMALSNVSIHANGEVNSGLRYELAGTHSNGVVGAFQVSFPVA